jgi:integrase
MDAGRLPQDTPNWWRQLMRGKLRSVGRLVAGRRVTTKRFLSADEMGKLVQWLPNFSEMVQDVLTLYLWTGTRGSEIVAMEAHEIQEEATGLWWTIPKVKTKNARHPQATDLRVPLIGRAAKIVQKRMASAPASGYLFAAETEEGGTHTAQQAIGAAVNYVQPYCQTAKRHVRERLPVTHWAPHDLRRSTRTLLASMGCPPEVAEAVLGHLPKGIEGTYNRHTYDLERLAWLTRLDEKLEALVGAHSS